MARKRVASGARPGEGLRKAARRVAREAAKGIAGGDSVHGTRRSLKFLHSLLVLIRPAIGEDSYRRDSEDLRRVSRALAAVRREGAMGEMAAKLDRIARPGAEANAAAAFGQAAKQLAGAAGEGGQPDAAELRRSLLDFARRIGTWPLPPADPTLYLDGARATLRRARRRIARGIKARDMAEMHRGRKALINHLHHLQLFAELGVDMDSERLARIEKLRGALGDMNDLHEAEQLLRQGTGKADPAVDRSALRKVLRRRRRSLLRKARRLARKVLAERPAVFAKRTRVALNATLMR